MSTELANALSLTEALKGLSGVKPRLCRKQIESWLNHASYFDGKRLRSRTIKLDDLTLTVEELVEIYDDTFDDWGKVMCSPAGVQTLIRLYERGHLPCKEGQNPSVDERLIQAAASGKRFSDLKVERDERRRNEIEQARKKLERPLHEIAEEEFTYSYLNSIFWHHGLKGDASLNIGNITVTKSCSRFKSNSGKSHDYQVTFSWISPNGGPRSVSSDSAFKGNRRNDAGRDWGLPS